MATTIVLVRHGETNFNVEGRIQGQSLESILTVKGMQEDSELGDALKLYYNIDQIISSDLIRAIDTAKIIADKLDKPHDSIIYDKRIREMGRGRWEETCPYSSNKWTEFEKNLNLGIDYLPIGINIESYASAMQRCKNLLDDLAQQYKDQTVLLVAHGEINKVFLAVSQNHNLKELLLNDRNKYKQPNCCINEIEIKNGFAYIKKADYINYRKTT